MKQHCDLNYIDIENVEKIVISKSMLKSIKTYFALNQVSDFVEFNLKKLNIEILLNPKINMFIEHRTDKKFIVTFFKNKIKLASFEIEQIFDIFFEVINVVEYEEILKCKETTEELILFTLQWFPMILFYIQAYSRTFLYEDKILTFFVKV